MPGAQHRLCKTGVRSDIPDLFVVHLDALDKLPDVALSERWIVTPQATASGVSKTGNIVLRQQPARDLFVRLERPNVADQIFAFIFNRGQGTAEHCGVVDRSVREGVVKALDP